MKISVNKRKKELVAVVTKDGALIMRFSLGCALEFDYEGICLLPENFSYVTKSTLKAWSKQKGSTSIYTGDAVTLQF